MRGSSTSVSVQVSGSHPLKQITAHLFACRGHISLCGRGKHDGFIPREKKPKEVSAGCRAGS